MKINIFTDGAYSPKTEKGGWAVYCPELRLRMCGAVKDTTNNRMELLSAIKALEFVDVVMFIVAKQNPFKEKSKACFSNRYEMCRQACFWEDKMMPVDFEKNLSGKTWDTLEYIKKVYTNAELYIICGDDTYFDIENWYYGEEILENYKFLVFKVSTSDNKRLNAT